MKNINFYLKTVLPLMILILVCLHVSEALGARELINAAKTAQKQVKDIAKILSVFGIISGGLLMQMPGLDYFGKKTLSAGLVGGVCAYGAEPFIKLLNSVFGSLT